MIIRNGNYTNYRNKELQLLEARQEMPIPFTHFILKWYDDEICPFSEFTRNEHDSIILILKREEVKNAFSVVTKAIYNKSEVFVWAFNKTSQILTVYTSDQPLAEAFDFIRLSDRYIKECKLSEIEKIWEERKPTEYDLPMPDGLQPVMEIQFT